MYLAAGKRHQIHCLGNEEKEKWIEDYIQRETTGARQRVADAEEAIRQEQEDTKTDGDAGLTTREPKNRCSAMMVAIGDSLSDIPRSDDGEDREAENDEETQQGKVSKDDQLCWGMGGISQTAQQHLGSFRLQQINLEELTQPEWGDPADYICESDVNDDTSEVRVVAVIKLQPDRDASAPVPTTFWELLDCLDVVPGISQIAQKTSQPGSRYVGLGPGKPQSDTGIPGHAPAAQPNRSPMPKAKPVDSVGCYICTQPPQLITIFILGLD
jgi:hypothetical protein